MSYKNRLMRTMSGCALVILGWAMGPAQPCAYADPPNAKASVPDYDKSIVAYVNGVAITRQELADDLIARKGNRHLELLINRKLIEQACQRANITVTDAEVEAELQSDRSAKNLMEPSNFEQFLRQQNMSLYEYKEDVVRPGIAMRKLVRDRVKVTEEELHKAFDANYGEKVKCRVILLPVQDMREAQREAQRIYFLVKDDPEQFLAQAKQQANPYLQSRGGEVTINRNSSMKVVEDAAFGLKDGEVSHILQTPEGLVVLRREELVPASKDKKFEAERPALEKNIFDKKMLAEVPVLFRELKSNARVRDYLNNKYDLKQTALEAVQRQGSRDAQGKATP